MSILFLRRGCELHDPLISPHGVGVKCPDDETNEQRILRASAITLSDHRAVYDAKCRRSQRGRGLIKCGHRRTWGEGEEKGSFFADVLYGRPLRVLHTGSASVKLMLRAALYKWANRT